MQRIPTLVGVSGFFEGELLALEYGKALSVGRSRTADLSLRRTRRYRELPDEQREKSLAAKTVSGKHFTVTMFNLGSIEIRNLSPNGIEVDGKPVQTVILDDVAHKPHEVRFGTGEVVRLEMRVHESV